MIPAMPEPIAAGFVRQCGLEVRNTLVSNAEFAGFINALADAGMPNGHGGTWLLACDTTRVPSTPAQMPGRPARSAASPRRSSHR